MSDYLLSSQQQTLPVQPRYKSFLKCLLVTLNLALSGFYFGFSIAYFATLPFQKVYEKYQITIFSKSVAQGILVGGVPIGGTIGTIILILLQSNQNINKKLSPRKLLYIVNLFGIISTFLMFFPHQYLLIVGRIGQGICSGFFISIVPTNIMQLAPLQISGFLGSLFQLLSGIGAFSSFLLQWILSAENIFNLPFDYYIYYIFSIPIIVSLIQVFCIIFVFPYGTPQYFIQRGMYKECRKLLKEFYKKKYIDIVFQEKMEDFFARQGKKVIDFQQKESQISMSKNQNKISLVQDILQESELKKSQIGYNMKQAKKITRFMAISLAILQNFSGVNIVLGYAPPIVNSIFPQLSQIIPIIINLEIIMGTLASGFLLKKFGRKDIFQYGTFANGVSLLILALGFILNNSVDTQNKFPGILIMIGLCATMASFSISLGPLVWLYIPQIVQAKFVPIASTLNCLAAVFTMVGFPIIVQALPNKNPYPLFLFLSIWCLVEVMINWKLMIETKGKNQSAIQRQYSQKMIF